MSWLRLVGLLLSAIALASMAVRTVSAQPSGDPPPGKGARPPSAQPAPGALQGPVKLQPALAKEATGLNLAPNWEAELDAHKALHADYVPWSLRYATYMSHVTSCLNKDHTVTDQKDAGCLQSDTLAVCMDRIYNACLAHPSRKLAEMGIPGLVNRAQALSEAASNLAKRVPQVLPRYRAVPTIRPAPAPVR